MSGTPKKNYLEITKRFKGLTLSPKILNKKKGEAEDIPNLDTERNFINALRKTIEREQQRRKIKKGKETPLVEDKILDFLRNLYDNFPCKLLIFNIMNQRDVPQYPSFYLFPVLYIAISDYNDDIDPS